jgi:hypothetical protein
MCRLSCLFPAQLMLLFRDNRLVGAPEISITGSTTIHLWKRLPEFPTASFAAISDHERHNLACLPAERKPNPALLCFLADKGPEFIQFECDATQITWDCWDQRLCERDQTLGFFLTSQSPYCAQHRTFVPIRASYCALDKRGGWFLAVDLNMPLCQDCRGFADDRFDRSTSACRWGQYRIL